MVVTFGGLHWGKNFILTCGSCSVAWRVCTNRAFALGPRKITGNLDRVGYSLALSNAVDVYNIFNSGLTSQKTNGISITYPKSLVMSKEVIAVCYVGKVKTVL